jgi:hypothetical protein
MEGLALLCHMGLLAAGFQEHVLGGVNYYTLGDVGPQRVVRAIRCVHGVLTQRPWPTPASAALTC